MTRSSTYVAALLVALMLAPGALATWRTLGSYEPDTIHDVEDGYMYPDHNIDPTSKQVYLNVVATQQGTSTNPNMLVEDSRVMPAAFAWDAFYGIWLDCNKDGYIGMADTALLEYRAELLPPDHVCPVQGLNNLHNQQGWVSELRWIGYPTGIDGNDPDTHPDTQDLRIIHDWGADIWGDIGAPGAAFGISAAACKTFYHRTGQTMNYADCRLAAATGVNSAAVAGPLGFSDDGETVDYDRQGNAPLNQETFGANDGANPSVRVWDCSERQAVQTGLGSNQKTEEIPIYDGYSIYEVQYTDEDGELNLTVRRSYQINGSSEKTTIASRDFRYFSPVVPSSNPGGSIAGTWNHTTDGATGDCDPSNGGGSIYFLEDPAVDVREAGKRSVNFEFVFWEEQRSGAGKKGQPFEAGVYPGVRGAPVRLFTGNRWFGGNHNTPPTLPPLVRSDTSIDGPKYFTFYANVTAETVGANSLKFAAAQPGKYGNEWCNGAVTGIPNGFNCNPKQWYINPDGSYQTNRGEGETVRPGHDFYTRDVDCYDYRIGPDGSVLFVGSGAIDNARRCAE